tara:strand:+ start:379 stop:606 length:228 start_codon:yes stop_codon:yes gene_type:complete
VNLEFIELELDWPSEISVFELRNYIIAELTNHGTPLRWAITSLTTNSGESIQKIFIEAIFEMHEDKTKDITTYLN